TVAFTCATPWCGTPEPVMRFPGHLSRRERRQLVTLFAHLIGTSFEEERAEDAHTFTFVRRLTAPQRVMELPVRAQRRP
ncbi:hypothetical protein HY632_04980, partial [Candidatus Uhrbacteria bacterium]|nr:hypothetical protein [Candidatus Uhrbacteria bacterium]